MHILVCGGAGYIGAHMCKYLAEAGHALTVFDNLSTGHAEAVRWGPLVQGDLLSPDTLEQAFVGGRFDAVMHFCARSLVGESVARPDIYYRNNVAGTLNLLDTMRRHNVPHLIFSSTAAVYGVPRYTPIDEQHPTEPINPYGRSKRMIESLLTDYDRAFGLRSVSLRYFNAAGAGPDGSLGERHNPETHLIPNILSSARRPGEHPLRIYGNTYSTPDGTCIRDYVHVIDLCSAHLAALGYLRAGGASAVFNLGSGRGSSVLEVIRCAEQVTGQRIPYTITDPRPGDPPILVASADQASRVLSWSPRYTDLSAIVETAWRWHARR
jgi:UDP-glucose 4-epimerase